MSRLLHIVAVLATFAVATGNVRADAATQREDQFKAAYVFNFVKFVEWPAAAGDTLTICFVGGNGVYAALTNGIASKRAGARSLAAVQVTDTMPAPRCEALYIEASKAANYLLPADPAVLTISDAANFTARGGMIGLFTENHRLRFVVNVQNANQAGLHISSDLLKLAADVQRGPR